MLIKRKSPLTGRINEREIPVTQEQIDRWQHSHELIQHVMPNVSADDREFLMTGYTPEDWAKIFPPEDEEEVA